MEFWCSRIAIAHHVIVGLHGLQEFCLSLKKYYLSAYVESTD